jgi:hypothetical protein
MGDYYYLDSNHQPQGPVPLPLLRNLRATDKIQDGTLVAAAGDSQWIPYSSLPEDAPPPPGSPIDRMNRTPHRTSGLAVTSLVLGCCVCFLGCLSGLPALITGIIALKQLGHNPYIGGRGFAITGIVLGSISLLLSLISIPILLPAINGGIEGANLAKAKIEMHEVGGLLVQYANAHEGRFPDTLDAVLDLPGTPSGEAKNTLFYRPGTKEYRWKLTPGLTTSSPPDTVLLESTDRYKVVARSGTLTFTVGGETSWTGDSNPR